MDGCICADVGLSFGSVVDDVAVDVGMAFGIGVPIRRALSSLYSCFDVFVGGVELTGNVFGATRCFANGVVDDDADDVGVGYVAFAVRCSATDGVPFAVGGAPFGSGTPFGGPPLMLMTLAHPLAMVLMLLLLLPLVMPILRADMKCRLDQRSAAVRCSWSQSSASLAANRPPALIRLPRSVQSACSWVRALKRARAHKGIMPIKGAGLYMRHPYKG